MEEFNCISEETMSDIEEKAKIEFFFLNAEKFNKGFSFVNNGFKKKGKWKRALTTFLKKTFKRPRNKTSFDKNSRCIFGREHGKKVDREINEYTRNRKMKRDGVDECTLSIIKFLKIKKWQPLISQMFITDSKMDLSTTIDLICYSKESKKLIVLEIKSGTQIYPDHNYDGISSFKWDINGPSSFTNNWLFHHQLQLFYQKEIFEKYISNNRKKKFIECEYYVLKSFSNVIKAYPLFSFSEGEKNTLLNIASKRSPLKKKRPLYKKKPKSTLKTQK